MLGRRTSTAPPVDDRGTPYPPIPKHAQSSFSSPEGDYLLAYEVSPPPPATPATPGGGNAAAVAAAAAAALAGQTNDYPATLSTAILVFPPSSSSSSGSGLLGLGGSQRSARSRGDPSGQDGIQGFTSMNTASAAGGGGASNNNNNILSSPMSAPGTQDDQTSSSHSGSSYSTPMDNTSSNAAGGSSTNASSAPSPVGRRKPLMSLPSMPSMPMPSLSSNTGNASNSNANGGNASAGPSTSKPKSAFRGTSSSFVKAYEGLPLGGRAEKMWQSNLEAREVTLAIYTTPRATVIVDISPRAKFRDPIAKIGFAATPTCTAVNMNTLSHERLDLLIGFHTGDIVWVEVFSGRYSRYNKDPTTSPPAGGKQTSFVSTSPVKKLQWLQGDQIFASAFQDGCVAFWDKDKEDPNSFVPTMGIAPGSGPIASSRRPPLARVDSTAADSVSNGNSEDGHAVLSGNGSVPINQRGEKHSRRHGSYHLATPDEYTDDIVVTVAQQQVDKKSSSNKFNPIAHWKVSRKSITDFAMSPDDQYCAVTSEDGCLRIIECSSQRLLDTFQGYFGALTCINWSPDGRFVLTGGQDDLACVWSPFEQRIVARCEGHSSFLTGLSFDPWRCDSRTQRFASVSEDCKLILWDLSSAALQRPKGHHQHAHQIAHQRRPSAMSSLSLSRRKTIESSGNLPSTGVVDREGPLWHGAAPRSEVPGLQPVTVKQISSDLLAGITFLPNMVVTISRGGTVKVFLRPDYRP